MAMEFQSSQRQFCAHLRDPASVSAPAGIEERRVSIYRSLVYNTIEGFISSGFPVLRGLLSGSQWHSLVRDFIRYHRCTTPYFLEISREFLDFLVSDRPVHDWEPPFLLELCHYEWVELALDTSPLAFPEYRDDRLDILDTVFSVSPLAWLLSYQFPVHRISSDFRPDMAPHEPTFLVVYRNRDHEVRFLEVNQIVTCLLQAIESNEATARKLLLDLAGQTESADPDAFVQFGADTLARFHQLGIVVPFPGQGE